MGTKRSKKKVELPYEKLGPLTNEDVRCPICWSILIEPVTLPCKHSLCLSCYKQHVEETSLQCPCCRMRLSVWSRKAMRTNTLVNVKFWERIKLEFPKRVEARLNNQDSQDLDVDDNENNGESRDFNSCQHCRNLACTCDPDSKIENGTVRRFDGELVRNGEIRNELDGLLKKHLEDIENTRRREEAASCEFIKNLQKEEGSTIEQLDHSVCDSDYELALKLQKEEQDRVRKEMSEKRKSFTQAQPKKTKKSTSTSSVRRKLIFGPTNTKSPSVSTKPLFIFTKTPSAALGSEKQAEKESQDSALTLQNGDSSFETSSFHSPSTPVSNSASKRKRTSPSPILRPVRNNKSASASKPPSKKKNRTCSSANKSCPSILDFVSSQKSNQDTISEDSQFESQSSTVSDPLNVTCSSFRSSTPIRRSSFVVVHPRESLRDSENSHKSFSVPLTKEKNSRVRESTPDSIYDEINCHFRPIRSAPKTPPKRLANGKYEKLKLIVSTPLRVSTPQPSTSSSAGISNNTDGLSIVDRVEQLKKAKAASNNNNIEIDKTSSSLSSQDSVMFLASHNKNNDEDSDAWSFVPESTTSEIESRPCFWPPEYARKDLTGLLPETRKRSAESMGLVEDEEDYKYDLNTSFNYVEETDRYLVLAEAQELLRLKQKAKQEAEDLKLAKLLQENINKGLDVIRSRKSSERYSIRSWLTVKTEEAGENSQDSSSVNNLNESTSLFGMSCSMSCSGSVVSSPRRSSRIASGGKSNSSKNNKGRGRKPSTSKKSSKRKTT